MTLMFKNKNSIFSEKNRMLIYQKEKKIRGSHYSIYSDGIIEIRGKLLSSTKLTIPKDLFQWFEISNPSRIFYVEIKLFTINTYSADIKAQFLCKKYGTFIQFLEQFDLKIGEQVLFKLDFRNSNIKPTPKFHKTLALLELLPLPSIETLSYLFTGGKGNREFSIYKDDRNVLFVKTNGILRDGGSVSLSRQLDYYFADWQRSIPMVLASKNEDRAMVLETRIIRQKSNRKFEKCLYLPHQGKDTAITLFFTALDLQLTKQAEQELELKRIFNKKGTFLNTIKSNIFTIGRHCDKAFEKIVRVLSEQVAVKQDLIQLPEVLLEFNELDENPNGNRKTVDIVSIDKMEQTVFLWEIKTSDKTLSSELESAIADLLHTAKKFKKLVNVFPLLFINQDILRLNNCLTFTKQYGLSCGILLLGLKETLSYLNSPQLLLNSLTEFTEKQALLTTSKDAMVHPITSEITSQSLIHTEAFLLLSSLTSLQSPDFSKYRLLMGISITDFLLLYNHLKELSSLNKIQKLHSLNTPIDTKKGSIRYSLMQMIHYLLIEKDYFAHIEIKVQQTQNPHLKVLLQHKQLLQEKLPPNIKIHDIKKRGGKGVLYEQEIYNILLLEGYQVASNVLLSNQSKLFEIDHIAFQAGKITLVSCKDRSNISDKLELPHLIREAANTLEFRKNLLNADKAILYVKVNKIFCENQQILFGKKNWVENVEIRIE